MKAEKGEGQSAASAASQPGTRFRALRGLVARQEGKEGKEAAAYPGTCSPLGRDPSHLGCGQGWKEACRGRRKARRGGQSHVAQL